MLEETNRWDNGTAKGKTLSYIRQDNELAGGE